MTQRFNNRATEEEAGGLLCCGPAGCGLLRKGKRFCAGNACMAWRWAQDYTVRTSHTFDGREPTVTYLPNGTSATHGYCGFAAEDLLPRTTVMPRGIHE